MADSPPAPKARSVWRTRVIIGLIAVIAIVILALIGSAVIPRWWAHRIGDQVSGSLFSGIGLGLFYGFTFTLIPLLVLWFVLSRSRRWQWRGTIIGIVVALFLALPNLMTLSIVIGSGAAAHAGERTLDVEAPNFRASTLIGVLMAAVAVAAVIWLFASRRRAKRIAKKATEPPAPAAE